MDLRTGRRGGAPRRDRVHGASIPFVHETAHGDHLVDDARELTCGLAAFHLRLPGDTIELVADALKDPDEDHGATWCMLQVLQEPNGLAGQQPIGAAGVGLTGLFGKGLRPRLRPGHREPGEIGDRVHKDDALARDDADQVRIGLSQVPVMTFAEERLLVGRRIHAADQTGDVESIGEAAHRDAVAGPVLDRLHPGFEIDAERLCRRQGLEQRGLSDAAWAEDRHSGLGARFCKALIDGDDTQAHRSCSIRSRTNVSAGIRRPPRIRAS